MIKKLQKLHHDVFFPDICVDLSDFRTSFGNFSSKHFFQSLALFAEVVVVVHRGGDDYGGGGGGEALQ